MGRRTNIKKLPSLVRLNELLKYDADSGLLSWNNLPPTSRANLGFNNKCGGKRAGTVASSGYLVVGIEKKYYLAHRIIWKLMTGSDPVDLIDHIDTDRLNNKWTNLREAANGSNIQNSRLRKDNKSGIKGVFWDGGHKSWVAVVGIDGKQIRLGRFKEIQHASEARRIASEKMHGQFARVA